MTGKEKLKFVKRQNLCFNCLKGQKNVHQKTNAFILNVQKHITSPSMTFCKKNPEEITAVENAKVCMSKLPQVQNIYPKIALIETRATKGEHISTYSLLDTGSESTMIRKDFSKRLNLRKNSKIVNISSIKYSGELVIKLYVIDEEDTPNFHINKALAIQR